MNSMLSQISLGVFLSLPPLLLGWRLLKKKPKWWVIALVIPLCGWATWLGAAYFHHEHILIGNCLGPGL